MKKIKFRLEGLNCANCAMKIEDKINKLRNVDEAVLNFTSKKLLVDLDDRADEDRLIKEIKDIIDSTEPGLDIIIETKNNIALDNKSILEDIISSLKTKQGRLTMVGIVTYLLAIYLFYMTDKKILAIVVFSIAYLASGLDIIKAAFKNIGQGNPFDENLLMTIATIGAAAIGEIPEAAGVMIFYNIGEFFQDLAVDKSRKNISALMDIAPDYANLIVGEKTIQVEPEEINIGDFILVKPGEKVPIDGEIVFGKSMVDTSAITGESVLRKVEVGDSILSGVINTQGTLKIRVTKNHSESTVAKILEMVENASNKKAPTENFITKFARVYTPIVVVAAAMISFLPPIIQVGDFKTWLYRGLIFLVVSCPCALVLSIPLSYFSGIGLASRRGILVKGGNYLEVLKDIKTVVMDKTGTITEGVFEIVAIESAQGVSEEELLTTAMVAEYNSNHPIAISIQEYFKSKYEQNINLSNIKSYKEIPARGLKLIYGEDEILAGNEKLMMDEKIDYSKSNNFGTFVYLAKNRKFLGVIAISDRIKKSTIGGINKLHDLGVKKVVMLTGDNYLVAENVAKKTQIDEFYADLLPADKVTMLERIGEKSDGKVAFVGDGVNDAPVLARADVGIAMGTLGSDAAIEASDVVLMTDDISKIPEAIEISKRTNMIVKQNIVFALSVKILVLTLGALGHADMWMAIFADVGVALLAVLNSMRLNSFIRNTKDKQ